MKVLILNSGLGRRMGVLTSEHPKCMTEVSSKDTILSRQLKLIAESGIKEVVMTTGYFDAVLVQYCRSLELPLHYTFVNNPLYDQTNYIYSIYCARDSLRDEDLVIMHGDLVFESSVFESVVNNERSCMAVSSKLELPEKDFKAVVRDGRIEKVGIEFFTDAVAAQPLYKLQKKDWNVWLDKICEFCESDNRKCYAENAFNQVSDSCEIYRLDVGDSLCAEIDTPEDLAVVSARLREIDNRTVYMCFSTDMIHSGHIAIIKKAQKLGKLIIGVLSDEAVASFKRFPLLPFEERKSIFENIAGVYKVVEQKTLGYADNLRTYRPDYVVHGDDWREGFQKQIRNETTSVLAEYGGKLVEYPYSKSEKYDELEKQSRAQLSMPDRRRGRLGKLIEMKGCVAALEAHSGITGLISEKTVVLRDGKTYQFDAMFVSSACDSALKGKRNISLVDDIARFRTVDDIMEVASKPIIFECDGQGLPDRFAHTVSSLERMGVSMAVVFDSDALGSGDFEKAFLERFCEKLRAGKNECKTKDFMICAGIESLIRGRSVDDALKRAFAYTAAGADAIMIKSAKTDPTEIFAFAESFRQEDKTTPIIVSPAPFSAATEDEYKAKGVNVVIYEDRLTRSGFAAMRNAAKSILENRRAAECDGSCASVDDIESFISEEYVGR